MLLDTSEPFVGATVVLRTRLYCARDYLRSSSVACELTATIVTYKSIVAVSRHVEGWLCLPSCWLDDDDDGL